MAVKIIQTDGRAIVLNLSKGASLCGELIDGLDVATFSVLIDKAMLEAGTKYAFGRYAEPRELYSSELFAIDDSGESRTIHMGIDLFCAARTSVYAPLDAVVEHVANNANELDYGPLVILRHPRPAGDDFFSLYGHLDLEVLERLSTGQNVAAGELIARVGAPPVNGNWPPHLHFQLITDLKGLGVDFPGVAGNRRKPYWLGLSPSPAAFFPEIDAPLLEYSQCN